MMTKPLEFDHAVILVNDLEQASADYQKLGFTVVYGGQHADGRTHNALIVFQNGTYLELLAPTQPETLLHIDPHDRSSFLFMFEQGEGFGGYALLSQSLQADVADMQQRGLNVRLRPAGGRARPDGQVLRWQSAMLDGTMTPFFIQDDTPRHLRVPNDTDSIRHENGATGVSSITVTVRELRAGIELYRAGLGAEPQSNLNSDLEEPTTAYFSLNTCTLILDSRQADTARADGDMLHNLSIQSPISAFTTLDTQRTHGARIAFQPF